MSMPPVEHEPPPIIGAGFGRSHSFAPGELKDLMSIERDKGLAQSARNRKRVLAHPDIAKKLTEHPLAFARPDQWSGYIPPETWRGKHNDSPQRNALLRIMDAVEKVEANG